MAVIDYPTTHEPSWKIPELNGLEAEYVQRNMLLDVPDGSSVRRWAHQRHGVWEESMRVPVRLEYLLLTSLHSQSHRLKEPIVISQESRLLNYVSLFMAGYVNMQKFITTVRLTFVRNAGLLTFKWRQN